MCIPYVCSETVDDLKAIKYEATFSKRRQDWWAGSYQKFNIV